ncbi:MAG: hypothetical protein ACXVIG_05855 [Halobacteriota archaeon]
MQSKEDATIVFAEPALPVLMDMQQLLGTDYATMVGVRGALGALLDSLRGTKKDEILAELMKNGVAVKLNEFIDRFSEFGVESVHLNVAATVEDNIYVLTAQASAGAKVKIKPKLARK